MNDNEIYDYLISRGAVLGKPFHNGEKEWQLRATVSQTGFEVLWEYGYKIAASELLAQGEDKQLITLHLDVLKSYLQIIEKDDVISMPHQLQSCLYTSFDSEFSNEPPIKVERLDERLVKGIKNFRVEMYTDESKHRGRPHVAVYLKNGKVSISLDNPPKILTPSGGLVGEASALKAIGKHREELLKLWHETRADTQKL